MAAAASVAAHGRLREQCRGVSGMHVPCVAWGRQQDARWLQHSVWPQSKHVTPLTPAASTLQWVVCWVHGLECQAMLQSAGQLGAALKPARPVIQSAGGMLAAAQKPAQETPSSQSPAHRH